MVTDADGTPRRAPPRAAFLLGVPRSGTTLLLRLLDGHPSLLVLPRETHAGDWHRERAPVRAFRDRRRIDGPFFPDGERRDRIEALLEERLPGPASLRDALLALVESYALLAPAPPAAIAWVEKTPNHLRRVPELARAFGPSTRFLYLVRDPRAVAASQFERWRRGGALHARTFSARWAYADHLARRWEAAVPGFRLLRYEDLVARPEEEMRGVAEHLGVPWDRRLLDPTLGGAPWPGNASSRRALDGIAAGDRGTRVLTAVEAGIVERLLAPRMRARGYAPADPAADRLSAGRAWSETVVRFRAFREEGAFAPALPEVSAFRADRARPGARLPAG